MSGGSRGIGATGSWMRAGLSLHYQARDHPVVMARERLPGLDGLLR